MFNKLYEKKINIIALTTGLLVCYITVASVFPPLRVIGPNYAIVYMFCMFLWMLVTFLRTPIFYLKPTPQRLLSILFIVYTFVYPYLSGNSTIGNRYMVLAPLFFLYTVYEYNKLFFSSKLNKNIIFITLFFSLITIVRTGFALLENPQVSRSLKATGEYSEALYRSGVGGYELIYFLVLMVPIVTLILLNKLYIGQAQKLLSVIYLFLSLSVIVLSNFFTALLISSFGIFAVFFLRRRNNLKYIILLTPILIIILIIWEDIAILVLKILINFIDEGKTYERISTLIFSITNNVSSNLYNVRSDLIMTSVNTFLEYPMKGIVGNEVVDSFVFNMKIGQHSHLADTFALFGLIPGIVQLYLLIQPFYTRMKQNVANNFLISMLVSLLGILAFNIAVPSLGIASSLIMPVIYDIYNEKITWKYNTFR